MTLIHDATTDDDADIKRKHLALAYKPRWQGWTGMEEARRLEVHPYIAHLTPLSST
jgi:hypothetical protein